MNLKSKYKNNYKEVYNSECFNDIKNNNEIFYSIYNNKNNNFIQNIYGNSNYNIKRIISKN